MADVEWVKLNIDMFDNRKIKHLRKLPEGNNIVLIWVMLITMAGRCNAGGMIFLTENIPYTTKMLADELGFNENVVIMALKAFEELNMISTDNNSLFVPGWDEYQNVDGLEKIREQNRKRVARHREKKKLEKLEQNNNEETQQDNDVQMSNFNAEIAWKKTFDIYPKKSGHSMAKIAWMDLLKDVIPSNQVKVAKLILNATNKYLTDYKERNPDDTDFRYIPKYEKWLREDCTYWMGLCEQDLKGE